MGNASESADQPTILIYRNRISWRNRLARAAWGVVYWTLFRFSPRPLYGWRRFLLRCFGAKIAAKVVVHSSVSIWAPWNLEMAEYACLAFGVDCYCVDHVYIGKHVTVSQYAFLCTASHDLSDPNRALVTAPIRLEELSWVFARAFIAPGVTLGQGAVAAACAVVVKNVAPWTIVGGNPARVIKSRTPPTTPAMT